MSKFMSLPIQKLKLWIGPEVNTNSFQMVAWTHQQAMDMSTQIQLKLLLLPPQKPLLLPPLRLLPQSPPLSPLFFNTETDSDRKTCQKNKLMRKSTDSLTPTQKLWIGLEAKNHSSWMAARTLNLATAMSHQKAGMFELQEILSKSWFSLFYYYLSYNNNNLQIILNYFFT